MTDSAVPMTYKEMTDSLRAAGHTPDPDRDEILQDREAVREIIDNVFKQMPRASWREATTWAVSWALLLGRQRAAELAKRIDALEQRTREWRYRGVWQENEQYETGNFVTERGELWHCNARTKTRPTDDTGHWTMCVKAGKNGRDARTPHPQV